MHPYVNAKRKDVNKNKNKGGFNVASGNPKIETRSRNRA
jgi:hypothetical protein